MYNHPIQHFPSVDHGRKRQCSTEPWYITISQDICPPVDHWGICMIMHARIHTSRTNSPSSLSPWRSRVALLQHCVCLRLFREGPFLGTRVRIPQLPSHILAKFYNTLWYYNKLVEHWRNFRQWPTDGKCCIGWYNSLHPRPLLKLGHLSPERVACYRGDLLMYICRHLSCLVVLVHFGAIRCTFAKKIRGVFAKWVIFKLCGKCGNQGEIEAISFMAIYQIYKKFLG